MQHVCGQAGTWAAFRFLPSVPPCTVELGRVSGSILGKGIPAWTQPAVPRPRPLSLTAGAGLGQQASQWSVTLCLTEQGAGAKGDFPPRLYPKLNSICSNACYNFEECLSCLSSAKHSQIMAEGKKNRYFVSCKNKLHRSAIPGGPAQKHSPLIGVTLGGQRQKGMKVLLGEGGSL